MVDHTLTPRNKTEARKRKQLRNWLSQNWGAHLIHIEIKDGVIDMTAYLLIVDVTEYGTATEFSFEPMPPLTRSITHKEAIQWQNFPPQKKDLEQSPDCPWG